jgi:hypothetical protein
MSFYSKLDKSASDLLKADDFDLNKKFSIKSATADGPVLTSSFTSKDVKKDANFADEVDRTEVTGNLKVEFKNKKVGEFTGEVDTAQLLSLTWKTPEVTKGLKFEVKGKHDRNWDKKQDKSTNLWTKNYKLDCFASAEAQYTRFSTLATTGLVKLTNPSGKDKSFDTLVGATGLFKYQSFAVGGEFEHNLSAAKKLDAGFSYAGSNWTLSAKTAKLVKEANVSVFSAVLPKTSVAFSAKYGFEDKKKALSAGVSQDIDDASNIKGLVTVEGSKKATVSLLYSASLSKYSKLSLSSVIEATKIAGGDHKFGVKLEVGDL